MNKFIQKLAVMAVGCVTALGIGLVSSSDKAEAVVGDTIASTTTASATTGYGRKTWETWVMSCGQQGFMGINKQTGFSSVKLTGNDLNLGKAIDGSITESTLGYVAFYSTVAYQKVGKITFSTSASSGATPKVYAVSGTSLTSSFSLLNLNGTGPAQGDNWSAGERTFSFDTIEESTYFGIVFYSATYCRLTGGSISFIEGDAATTGKTDQEIADEFMARLTALEGKVTLEDADEIANIKTAYIGLSASVKVIVDEAGYAAQIAALETELAAANKVVADSVVALIAALPAVETITIDNVFAVKTSAVAARVAYDALTEAQKAMVGNYAVLQAVETKIVEVIPTPTVEGKYVFGSGTTMPDAQWKSSGASAYFTSLLGFKAVNNSITKTLVLAGTDKVTTSVTVGVRGFNNAASSTSAFTVKGFKGGASGTLVDSKIIQLESTNSLGSQASVIINKIATDDKYLKEVTLNGEIDTVQVVMTTFGNNAAITHVDISYFPGVVAEDDADVLIAMMNELNTCINYADAATIRELYNELTTELKAKFDGTVCAEDENCTMAQKLAYMELLAEKNKPSANEVAPITNVNDNTLSIALITLVAVLGLSAVAAYYFLNKKRARA